MNYVKEGDELFDISNLEVKKCIVTTVYLYEEVFDVAYEDGAIKQFDISCFNSSMFYDECFAECELDNVLKSICGIST